MTVSPVTLASLKALAIALVLTPIVRDVFRAYNVVDRPGRRKVHAYPIPRVGGIPIAAGFLLAMLGLASTSTPVQANSIWALIPGAVAIFATGLIDDFFNLRPVVKLLGQIGAALLIYANGIRLERLGSLELPAWVSLGLTVFWLLLTTNALNLIDGLDGLCAGMGFFAALSLGLAGIIQPNPALTFIAFSLAAAQLGFLVYNLNPATVFLGDSGALTIGFLLGCLGLIWSVESPTVASLVAPLLAMAVPLCDVLISVIRRYLKHAPLFGADRGHTHHRLLDRGLSVRQATGILYLVALAGGGFAFLLTWQPMAGGYHAAVLTAFCVVCGIGVRQLRYPEFEATKTLLLGEFRNAVAAKARLGQLREALSRGQGEGQWWDLLTRACKEEGLLSLVFTSDSGKREDYISLGEPAWHFEVALPGKGVIKLGGKASVGHEGAGVNLPELAGILLQTFGEMRAAEKSTGR